MPDEKATQRARILKLLQSGRTLTGMQAVTQLKIMSYTRRIAELRAEGHKIQTELVSRNGKTFGRYSLEAQ